MATPAPTSKDLRAALEAGVIDAPTYRRLVEFLATPMVETPSRFDFANLLWYIGALIVLGAMGLFSTTAFGLWGTKALLATSVGYAIAFLAVGAYLWNWRGLRTPGDSLSPAPWAWRRCSCSRFSRCPAMIRRKRFPIAISMSGLNRAGCQWNLGPSPRAL